MLRSISAHSSDCSTGARLSLEHHHHIILLSPVLALGVVDHLRRFQLTAGHLEVYHTVDFLKRVAYFGMFLCRFSATKREWLPMVLYMHSSVVVFTAYMSQKKYIVEYLIFKY